MNEITSLDLNGYAPETIANAFNPRALQLIILPTEKCNFRCTYCYETFEIGRMRPWTVEGIKNLIDRRTPELDRLTLSWFGGEPLVAKGVILDIARHAKEAAEHYTCHFSGGMTTNGYLLNTELASELSALRHYHYQITLDGDEESHNRTRVKANGSGTFREIWRNLQALHVTDLEFRITIRLHLSPENYASQKRLVEKINDSIGADDRFDLHFHRITDLGGPNSGKFPVYSDSEYREVLDEMTALAGLRSESEGSLHESYSICYAAKPNSLLIRADGRLGKCTVALDNPLNDIGHINPDGTVNVRDERLQGWLLGYEDMDHATLTCPLSTIHNKLKHKDDLRVKVLA